MNNRNNDIYEFSVPMPFHAEGMNQIIALNKRLKKTKITSVYNCIPEESEDFTYFEQPRLASFPDISTLDDLLQIASIGQRAGIDFIYICNSPAEKTELQMVEACEKIDVLVAKMKEYGFCKIRVTNIQLIDYLLVNHPDIKVLTSTSQEFSTTQEYLQMLKQYPNITEILPSWDTNRNISFIHGLNAVIPQDIEIMVNEGCIPGCPFRTQHNAYLDKFNDCFEVPTDAQELLTQTFYSKTCSRIFDSFNWEMICLSNIIYPWDIEKYSMATGIHKFKLVGRNCSSFKTGDYIAAYADYLLAIDDPESILDKSFSLTNHYIVDIEYFKNIKIRDIKSYLPSIDFFINTHPDCRNDCGEKCRYCYEKAKSINCSGLHIGCN